MGLSDYQRFGTYNAILPKEGPKTFPFKLDFTVKNEQEIDLMLPIQQGFVSFFSGMFVDNSLNAAPLRVRIETTDQLLIVPSLSQGYCPLLISDSPLLTFNTTAAATLFIPVQMLNFPVDASFWKIA